MEMRLKMKCGQEDKWTRTGCLQTDMLHAFESGDWHDCTIRVGFDLKNPKATFKVGRYSLQIVASVVNFHVQLLSDSIILEEDFKKSITFNIKTTLFFYFSKLQL
jgi:hypothetical protein